MNPFEQILAPYMQPPQPAPEDYRDEQGYLCCGICHTRKEYRLDIAGEIHTVPVACRHIQQQKQREQELRQKQDRIQRIQDRITDFCSWGAAIRPKATFDQDDGKSPDSAAKIKGYVTNFKKALERNLGLMLYGTPGTGKTFYAEAIANELCRNGYFAWLSSIRMLSAAVNQNYGEYRPMLFRYIERADLLILDDFGAERDTSFMAEQVYEIINTRYQAHKPLVVTTNLDPKTMAGERDVSARRIYERVMEMCAAIEIKGETRRRQIASRKISDLRDILGLEA